MLIHCLFFENGVRQFFLQILFYDIDIIQAERVVRPSGARRMRRRPAAASSSAASTSEGNFLFDQ